MSKRRFICTPEDLAQVEFDIAAFAAGRSLTIAEFVTDYVNRLALSMAVDVVTPDSDTEASFVLALAEPNALNLHYADHHFTYQMLQAHYGGFQLEYIYSAAKLESMEQVNADCSHGHTLVKAVQPWEANWYDNRKKFKAA